MKRRINFLDIETTGLNEPEHRIIEHCSNVWDLDTRQKVKAWTWRIDPQRTISQSAKKVHGIGADDLVGCPTMEKVAHLIKGTIEPMFMVVAHNGDFFDFPFLDRELSRVGQYTKFPTKFDTMTQSRWATFNGKNAKLGEMAQCLDVEYDPSKAHGAEYDTDVMAECFFKGLDLGFFKIPGIN